ncbi:MAG TPA: cytochrome c3 family protein [Thermoanaerobaculia bacterium]|nr:cytochrome c3 family protein [Thermoanaerobaculia bacterium]
MAQIFPRWTLRIPLILVSVLPVLGAAAVGAVWYYGSPEYTDVGYRPKQPVPYSHALHVGQLRLDCRYCHASVEQSAVANVPPTKVCMNCHHVVLKESALLEPIRTSLESGRPMRWVRVHDLPDYVFFDHAAHVGAGVGCASCHGAVQEMVVVTQVEPLSMAWCLDCHRDPAPHLRPLEAVTDMEWTPLEGHQELARQAMTERQIDPPTDCSGCHR